MLQVCESYGPNLDTCPEGTVLGLLVDASGCLHLYVNSMDQGVAAQDIPSPCYVLIDLYGQCEQVRPPAGPPGGRRPPQSPLARAPGRWWVGAHRELFLGGGREAVQGAGAGAGQAEGPPPVAKEWRLLLQWVLRAPHRLQASETALRSALRFLRPPHRGLFPRLP